MSVLSIGEFELVPFEMPKNRVKWGQRWCGGGSAVVWRWVGGDLGSEAGTYSIGDAHESSQMAYTTATHLHT
jgi:hypothetical protein